MDVQTLYNYLHAIFRYENGNLYYKKQIVNKIQIDQKAGSFKNTGYWGIQINNKKYQAHRLIFLYHHGYLPKYIDHIDRNKLNNKIENLREITNADNKHNTPQRKDNKIKYKGINWHKKVKKWVAQIQINGKKKHIGYFVSPELAYAAYCEYVKNNLTVYCLE